MVKTHPAVVAIGQQKGHPTTQFKLSEKQLFLLQTFAAVTPAVNARPTA